MSLSEERAYLRHQRWYKTARFLCPILLRKYSFHTDVCEAFPEPTIILSNHTTESDVFMIARAFKQHIYFVCGEHLLRSKIGGLLQYVADPISAPRGGRKLTTITQIRKRIKQGHSIAMFPEGCRSFNGETLSIPLSTAKLIKSMGVGLITYRIHGGYFIAPRWAYVFRKGHAEGKIVHQYTSSNLAQMTAEEVCQHINEDLYENAYSYQIEHHYSYRGKRLAEGLENYLVLCPKCGQYDTMVTQDNRFKCSSCGLEGIYDVFGMLQGEDLPFHSVYDWGKWMTEQFQKNLDASQEHVLFCESDITLYRLLPDLKREDLAIGELCIDRNGIRFHGDNAEFNCLYKDMEEKSLLYYGKTFLFTNKDGYYGLTGNHFHAWKLDQIFEHCREN